MQLGRFGHAIGKYIDNVSRVFSLISAVAVFAVFAVEVVDVTGRYFFHSPIPGSNDISQLLLIPVAFLAIAYTQLEKEHVRVTLIYEKLSKRGQAIMDIIAFVVGAAVFGLIAWNMGERAVKVMAGTYLSVQTSPVLKIPYLPFFWVLTLGSFQLCLQLLTDAIRACTRLTKTAKV